MIIGCCQNGEQPRGGRKTAHSFEWPCVASAFGPGVTSDGATARYRDHSALGSVLHASPNGFGQANYYAD